MYLTDAHIDFFIDSQYEDNISFVTFTFSCANG